MAGLAMAAYVHHWTRDRTAALAAGCLFAFAPYRLWQLGNLHVISIHWMPLVLLGIDLALDGRRAGAALLGLALAPSDALLVLRRLHDVRARRRLRARRARDPARAAGPACRRSASGSAPRRSSSPPSRSRTCCSSAGVIPASRRVEQFEASRSCGSP
jgi:hypothetical protein